MRSPAASTIAARPSALPTLATTVSAPRSASGASRVALDVDRHDRRAEVEQPVRDRGADALRRAGDDGPRLGPLHVSLPSRRPRGASPPRAARPRRVPQSSISSAPGPEVPELHAHRQVRVGREQRLEHARQVDLAGAQRDRARADQAVVRPRHVILEVHHAHAPRQPPRRLDRVVADAHPVARVEADAEVRRVELVEHLPPSRPASGRRGSPGPARRPRSRRQRDRRPQRGEHARHEARARLVEARPGPADDHPHQRQAGVRGAARSTPRRSAACCASRAEAQPLRVAVGEHELAPAPRLRAAPRRRPRPAAAARSSPATARRRRGGAPPRSRRRSRPRRRARRRLLLAGPHLAQQAVVRVGVDADAHGRPRPQTRDSRWPLRALL